MAVDRRTFLRAGLGLAGLGATGVLLRSITDTSPEGSSSATTLPRLPDTTLPLRPAQELPPAPRPTLRLGGGDYDWPTPFWYLPPAYGLMSYVYDSLLMRQPDRTTFIPWLAARYQPAPDGLSHTFELRDNVRWHDGKPFTAGDVVFSFDYFKAVAARGGVQPWVLFRPENVERVTASGPKTVTIHLDKPTVTFALAVGSRFPIFPRHVWEGIDKPNEVRNKNVVVGTGPYRLERYGFGQGYLFTANDDFYLGKPFVKRIERPAPPDELTALQADQIDAGGFDAEATSAKALDPFRRDPKYGVLVGPPDFVIALQWNVGKPGAVADVRFRRACAYAIDRQAMVDRLLGGNGAPGNPGFLPPEHDYRVDVEQYPYDPERAGRLLDEAGYRARSGGRRVGADGKPLHLTVSAPPTLVSAVEFVVDALKRLGLDISVNPVESGIAIGDYEMAVLFYGGTSDDPDYLRRVYSSRVEKLFMAAKGYRNPEVDDLAERQLVTLDAGERKAMVARIQQLVATDLPLLHLYYPATFLVFKKSVFDQWNLSASDKQVLVTGVGTGGTTIRPIA